jgi:anti-sigma factor RsiW
MNCRQFHRQYSAYRDGHDPILAAEMDDHLDICPRCAAFDRAVREGVDTLRGTRITPSADFRVRLADRLASGETVPDPVPPRISPWAATAAAILFLTMVSLTVRNISVLPTPVAAETTPMVVAKPTVIPGIPFVAFERMK